MRYSTRITLKLPFNERYQRLYSSSDHGTILATMRISVKNLIVNLDVDMNYLVKDTRPLTIYPGKRSDRRRENLMVM